MRTISIAAALALLSACSGGGDASANRLPPTDVVKQDGREPSVGTPQDSTAANGLEGYPTSQPDGTPLTVDYCLRAGEEANSPFDNSKACFMVACEQGDRASCDMAATYNGNLKQD